MGILSKTLLLLALMMPISLWAEAEVSSEDGGLDTVDSYGHRESEAMEKMMADPEVQPYIEQCRSEDEPSNCLKDKLEKEGIYGQIIAKYFPEYQSSGSDNSEQPTASAKNDKTAPVTESYLKVNKDAGISKVEEYLGRELQKALYGKAKSAEVKGVIVDQDYFNTLYKNQISKNIISTISSFCLDTQFARNKIGNDEYKFLLIPHPDSKDGNGVPMIEKVREVNLKRLATFNQGANIASRQWKTCTSSLEQICKDQSSYYSNCDDKCGKKDKEETNRRACLATRYLRNQRQGLIITEEISKEWKDRDRKNQGQERSRGFASTGYEELDKKSARKILEENTNITSNEFVNTSGYREELDKEVQALKERCSKESYDEEFCDKYLNSDEQRDRLRDMVVSQDLKAAANIEQIKKMDKGQLNQFFKKEGRSDQQIEALLKKFNNDEEKIKDYIEKQYENEKKAMAESLMKQIEMHSKNPTNSSSTSEPADQIEKISKDMEKRAETYKQLIHYNNIVAGYLEMDDGKGNKEQNLRPLMRELDDNAYEQGRDLASSNPNTTSAGYGSNSDIRALKDNTKQNLPEGAGTSKSIGEQEGFSVKTINDNVLTFGAPQREEENQPNQP